MKEDPITMFTRESLTVEINQVLHQPKRRIMKNNILTFAVIGFMAGTFLAGCDKTPEKKVEATQETKVQDAKQGLQDARAEYLKEWEAFKAESELQIAANEKRIDAYKEKMEKAGPKAKAQYKKDVVALKQKNHELKEKLEAYKDEGQGKWEEFKTNFKNDMAAVGKTMKDLFKDKD